MPGVNTPRVSCCWLLSEALQPELCRGHRQIVTRFVKSPDRVAVCKKGAWIKVVWRALKRWYDLGAQKRMGNTSLPQGLQTKPFSSLPKSGDRIRITTRCLLNESNFCCSTQDIQHMFSTNKVPYQTSAWGKLSTPRLLLGPPRGSREG